MEDTVNGIWRTDGNMDELKVGYLKAHTTFKVTVTFICLFRYSRQHYLMWDQFYSSKLISFA